MKTPQLAATVPKDAPRRAARQHYPVAPGAPLAPSCSPPLRSLARSDSRPQDTRIIDDPPATLPSRIARPAVAGRVACVDDGGAFTYADLLGEAMAWRDALLGGSSTAAEGSRDRARSGINRGDRVAYLVPPGRDHVAIQLGIWLAGGIAVPLAASHPLRELEYILGDAQPRTLVADPHHPATHPLTASPSARAATILTLDARPPAPSAATPHGDTPHGDTPTRHPTSPAVPPGDHTHTATLPLPHHPALLIYTSGTTGRPRGVLTTHANLAAQITALTAAWAWTAHDRILHTLPLHHIHGVVNALACALWSGAAVEFGGGAPAATWDRLASGEITLFMSVPTVYTRLIRAWEEAAAAVRERWSRGAAGVRLMVSGSAALPVRTFERWRAITGHDLLERYGMTEIGMALSNPLHGQRRPGHVGHPLPGVELRLVDDDGRPITPLEPAALSPASAGRSGEIEVRGPQVFREYWRRPAETAAAFRDGWFRTGDEACIGEGGCYRILGRRNIDIVKTGGYKVSALEVEEVYRTHPAVRDMAVVGVPHPEWGEQLRAAWVPAGAGGRAEATGPVAAPTLPDSAELRAWGKERLAPYKVPHTFMAVAALPRNAMGKVQKPAVRRMLTDPEARSATSRSRGSADPPESRTADLHRPRRQIP